MEFDFEIILYIIFVVVALLSRLLKKRNQPTQTPPTEREQDQEPSQTITFEDLLKEFETKSSKPKEAAPRPRVERKPEPVRQEEFRDKIPDDDEIKQVYEDSIKQAKQDTPPERERPVFEHFQAFEEEEEVNELALEIREMFKNPKDAAKAVVLSEILNRKY